MTFCDELRASFGALPGSSLTVMSPPTTDSILPLGVCGRLSLLSGDCVRDEERFEGEKSGRGVIGVDVREVTFIMSAPDRAPPSSLRCFTSSSISSSFLTMSPPDMIKACAGSQRCGAATSGVRGW